MTTALLPWMTGPSIYEVIRDWHDGSPCDLPDESPNPGNQIRFAAGAWDGILGHHVSGLDEQEEARFIARLIAALARLIQRDDDAARVHLYEQLQGESLVRHVDVFLRELTDQEKIGPIDVRPHARWLVRHAAHRNPLKFGLALLGVSGTSKDVADLRILARHDEFTLYAAVAAANLVEDPIGEWWSMARFVHGWGKVHLVERLCQRAEDRPSLRSWLIRHGCANEVMPEYLALDCAIAGQLSEELAVPLEDADDELIDGAGVILMALLSPYSPAGTIDSYPDAVEAVQALMDHLEQRCDTLTRLSVVQQIAGWLEGGDEEIWEARQEFGWTEAIREELTEQAERILSWPDWTERIRDAFLHDPEQRILAWDLATTLEVDLWDEAFAQLRNKPDDAWLYSVLGAGDDLDRVRRVVAFGEEHLPLADIGSGPGDLLGLGPDFVPHACLDALLQHMQRPGVFSVSLVTTAMRSPVVRNRHLAAAALEAHLGQLHKPGILAAIDQTRADEVNDELKQKWRTLSEQTISEEDDLLQE